ncbi:MAG: hypothetical protein ABI905_05475 [Betaproteobacteria bacterium]
MSITLGPVTSRLRVTAEGLAEMVGDVGDEVEKSPDVSFRIPLSLLPRLLQKDETAYSEVEFTGDSEFASLLSTLARNIEWDIEEDLSGIVGDITAHRIVDTAKRTHEWRVEASQRFTENVAEYLTEEKRAFITRHDLETLSFANESLRDDVARLEARLAKMTTKAVSR